MNLRRKFSFKVFLMTRLLLALAVITTPALGDDSVGQIIDECTNSTSENGSPRPDATPNEIGENIEKRQKPFECITDRLEGSLDSLNGNEKYENLVAKCKSEQPKSKCDPDYPYRTMNGMCNNLKNPTLGASFTCASRIMEASYEGAAGFRKSKCNNQDLPNPRNISRFYMTDVPKPAFLTSSYVVYFGQLVAHDISNSFTTPGLQCCPDSEDLPAQCAPYHTDEDDTFYRKRNVTCFPFTRVAPCDTCSVGKRFHINIPTHYIDLSMVYGSSENGAKSLRRLDESGKLKIQDSKAGDLLPPDTTNPTQCGTHAPGSGGPLPDVSFNESSKDPTTEDREYYCFKAGDGRVNQHTTLMILQTVFVREHNRIAGVLKEINPHWGEEKIYQEARKINIAQFQNIVYKEFLPQLLGTELMNENDLSISNGARTKYDEEVQASIFSLFSNAAYRLHSMVPRKISKCAPDTPGTSYLRYLYRNTHPIYNDKMEEILQNLVLWPYEKFDEHVVEDVSGYLLKERFQTCGGDIAAIDIQRGRDDGLPPYVEVLEYFYDDNNIQDFDDLVYYIQPELITKLKEIYCDVRDIDLWVGINSERKEKVMALPKTTRQIIAEQFRRLKFGDRFWFENPNHFTDEQLCELRNSSLSRIFCDNTKLTEVPPNSFKFPSPENSIVSCTLLPTVNLEKWKESDSDDDDESDNKEYDN